MYSRNNVSFQLSLIIIFLFCINPAHSAEIILDNNQSGTVATGSWLRSGGANSYGTQSLYSREVGATYSYTIPVTTADTYDVNLWWTEFHNRSTNVAIDITHRDGTARIYINQKQNGGQWNKVGSWYFDADAIVTIHSDSTDNSTNADAVQLVSVISGGNGNNAPAISGVPATTVTVETTYSFVPSANDADGDNLTFNISNKPGWANFNSSTGALTGTPTIRDEGTTQNIVISISDGLQTTSLPAFNLTVVQENLGGSVVELILDNNQPGTVASGNWLRSGGANSYGTQSLYSREVGATYSYTIPIAESGTYDVNLWWTEFYNRSTNVAVDITHRDGTARIYINQKQNGGQWNQVGSWYFDANAIITIYSEATDKSTNADAVQLVSVTSGGTGNSAPTISGVPATTVTVETTYSFIPSANDADGDNLTFNISNKPDWASFNSSTGALTETPTMGDEGTTQNIVISVSDGLQTTSLPAFNLTVVQEDSGGAIVELILDNNQPGTVATGNWLRSSGANSYGTQSLYSREVGATYRYTIPIATAGTYDVNLWWTEFYNRATNVAVDITHRDGTARIYINQKQNGGQWNKVGSWYFDNDAIITIHSDATDKSTNADAVRLVSADSGGNTNSAPTIGGIPATAVTVDTTYLFSPNANDADGDNLTFNISNKPDWASFNSSTGALTGTPIMGDEGATQNILISVSDGLQTTSLPAFNITVNRQRVVSAPILDPTLGITNNFGEYVIILPNGNIVITGLYFDATWKNVVHLYNPLTQTFIASFYDYLFPSFIAVLKNSNFVIHSSSLSQTVLINGTTGTEIGATNIFRRSLPFTDVLANNNYVIRSLDHSVQLINGNTGLQISSIPIDYGIVTVLANSNFVISSPFYNEGGIVEAGSVRLFNGSTGLQIGATLTGDTENDQIGRGGVTALANNNFVISSPGDDEGGIINAGSVRLFNGSTGLQIGATLTGDTENDQLSFGSITTLTNSNFVINSPRDDEEGIIDAGSMRLVNGTTGIQIGPTLVGDTPSGFFNSERFSGISSGVVALKNNNFVVGLPNNGLSQNGLVRLMNGNTGVQIGVTFEGMSRMPFPLSNINRITALKNSNFVIASDLAPARLVSGTTGVQIGATWNDSDLPVIFTALENNNFVINSPLEDKGDVIDAGSVRLMNGVTGVQIGATLFGDTKGDQLGESDSSDRFNTLMNSNFFIVSLLDDEEGIVDAGSARLVNGSTGVQMGATIAGRVTEDMLNAKMIESPKGDFYILSMPYADHNGLTDSGRVILIAQ